MPRPLRIDIPGSVYHVINRGVKKQAFFHDDEDRWEFLDWLKQTRRHYDFQVQQYGLMTNHFHLLLRLGEASLSRLMQYFGSRLAKSFNRKYSQGGHFFESRFHSIPVETDTYYKVVSRYIHLNPVKAGMVAKPEDYPWSNYHSLINGLHDPIADPAFLLDHFPPEDGFQRERYRRFVEDDITSPPLISDWVLQRLRSWGRLPVALAQRPR